MSNPNVEWIGLPKAALLLGFSHRRTHKHAVAGKLGPTRTDERGNILAARAEIEKRRLLTQEEFARVMAMPAPRNDSRDRERLRHGRRDP